LIALHYCRSPKKRDILLSHADIFSIGTPFRFQPFIITILYLLMDFFSQFPLLLFIFSWLESSLNHGDITDDNDSTGGHDEKARDLLSGRWIPCHGGHPRLVLDPGSQL
jgi:hypothetical protein